MQIYLVGGAVRDELLGRQVKEKDWVVVGATPEWMIEQGYQPVGKDFPVFLHPKTKEEYALARTERKSGKGYKGFICYAAPDVTLEDDLKRRDITINAIAKSQQGEIIDPYHGQEDLKNKILRHVSPAFAEDPLRVLRVARFAAYLSDFKVHPKTLQLMQHLSESGELLTLSPERIWKELERVMLTQSPVRFFEVLEACHAMPILFPEIETLDVLKSVVKMSSEPLMRLSSLMSTLDKNKIKTLSIRASIPNAYQELASLAASYFPMYRESLTLKAREMLMLFKKTDAFRRPERFKEFLFICQIREGVIGEDKKHELLEKAFIAAKTVKLDVEKMREMSGTEIGEALDKKREEKIERLIKPGI